MAKIAYCWELGGGLGHMTSFMPVADHLKKNGHEVVFIVRDLTNTGELVGKYGFEVFQAPVWHPKVRKLPDPLNYAEILFRFGYLSQSRLFDMVMGWKNILQVIGPDHAVFDHSPTANLGSKCLPMKRAFFGTGFCAPPRVIPMPTIRPWLKVPLQRLQNSENRALQVINSVLTRIDVPVLKKLMNLFDCDENFLATFPELDHYQGRGEVRYWGPSMSMDEGSDPFWPGIGKGKKIFAYLKGGVKGIPEVLQVLKDTPADVIVYGPGLPLAQIKKFQTERLIIVQKILNLKKVCKECDLVICHAGHATLARALVEGIPVVMLPTQVEQFIMSTNIARFGAGTMVNHQDKQPDYAGAINRALMDKNIKQKAQEFAARHADFDQKKQVAAIVSRIEELITPVS